MDDRARPVSFACVFFVFLYIYSKSHQSLNCTMIVIRETLNCFYYFLVAQVDNGL